MIAIPTLFKEVFLIKPVLNSDTRGIFIESYSQKDFKKVTSWELNFCQHNQVISKMGVLRGLHFQLPPFSQSKLVSVIVGNVLDVVVDIRKGSPTFGQHFSQELSATNRLELFIPRGFAHGYITLSKTSIFQYKVDQYYHPQRSNNLFGLQFQT